MITPEAGPIAIKGAIEPVPLAAKPIPGFVLVQDTPVGTRMGGVKLPIHKVIGVLFVVGSGIVKVTVNGYILHPSAVKTLLPLKMVKEIGTPVGKPV